VVGFGNGLDLMLLLGVGFYLCMLRCLFVSWVLVPVCLILCLCGDSFVFVVCLWWWVCYVCHMGRCFSFIGFVVFVRIWLWRVLLQLFCFVCCYNTGVWVALCNCLACTCIGYCVVFFLF